MTPNSNATRNVADDVAMAAGQAASTGQAFAADVAGTAADKVRELRRDFDPVVDEWSERLKTAAQRSIDAISETSGRARESISRGANLAGQYVADQPIRSVLIAAAAGAAITALIIAASRRR